MAEKTLATKPKATAPADPPPSIEEVRALLKRAESGDESTLPQLRAAFDRPDLHFRSILNVEELARQTVAGKLVGKDVGSRELLLRKIAALAAELAGPDPTPIERLLADRAAFCWHVVNYYERDYACQDGLSIKQADYHQRRIDSAHRRYLSSLKTLATVRKLALPTIQVNVARQQVIAACP